ncbi:hypothetical protein [Rhodococcus opacus]|uniref:hypothetical protein n=1 Tax=Rhodococcus opacus TaxID=37919 RepID=UPI000ACE1E9A|nr:hypothetical protein [Rhodococcus opacus]
MTKGSFTPGAVSVLDDDVVSALGIGVGVSADEGAGAGVMDGVTDEEAEESGASVEALGATRSTAGASLDDLVGGTGVVVLVLGVGVGVVVGCAAAIPPPVAINTAVNDATTNDAAGEARFGHGKFRYFATLAI